MSVIKETKEKILEALKTLPVCEPNSTETQWVVRCPYCGDSHDQSHGHLSIHLDTTSDDTMLWRCFKCDESGLVTEDLLKDLGLYIDTELKSYLKDASRKASKYNKFLNDYVEKLIIPKYSSGISKRNLDYINQRIGTKFTIDDADRYHMILDLGEFMSVNGLKEIPGVSSRMTWFVQQNYVGFLTANKNTMVMRRVTDIKTAKRYLKYKINPMNQNPAGFYNIPRELNIMTNQDIHLHVAEGIFDILSIEKNLYFQEDTNINIFFASCGFGPMTVVQYLVYMGIGGNIILHVYCDNDKSDWEEIKVLRRREEMLPWCKEIYFHRNQFENEKDYGVPLDKIIDSKRKIIL